MKVIGTYKYPFAISPTPSSRYFQSSVLQSKQISRLPETDMSKIQKAWFFNQYGSIEYGSIDVFQFLQFGELPVPKPGPGHLLVKIRAAALNPLDYRRLGGFYRSVDSDFPVLTWALFFLFLTKAHHLSF